jgi:enamine deaminase RidA (YjgF/YER057c/UK114 family)
MVDFYRRSTRASERQVDVSRVSSTKHAPGLDPRVDTGSGRENADAGGIMIRRLRPGKRLSMATIHSGLAYLAGQVPDDLSLGVEAQAAQVLGKIDALLEEAGTDKSSILTATVWLASIADFAAFNTVWDAWVPDGASPARACVEARLANPSIRVEIAVIAAVP